MINCTDCGWIGTVSETINKKTFKEECPMCKSKDLFPTEEMKSRTKDFEQRMKTNQFYRKDYFKNK